MTHFEFDLNEKKDCNLCIDMACKIELNGITKTNEILLIVSNYFLEEKNYFLSHSTNFRNSSI